jgi:nitrate/nitrite-specific signal transduction histidine kinase
MAGRQTTQLERVRTGAGRAEGRLAAQLRAVERIFSGPDRRGRGALAPVRRRARARALALADGAPDRPERVQLALRHAAAGLLVSMAAELADRPAEASRIVAEIEEVLDVGSLDLALDVLRAPELLSLPPQVAIRAELALLSAFAGLRTATLFVRDRSGRAHYVAHLGDDGPTATARALAARVLAGEEQGPRPRGLIGVPVPVAEEPAGALVAGSSAGARSRARSLMEGLAPLLAAVLERDALLAGNAESQRSLIESSERRLTRLAFDLHDGPLQDLAVLAEDLRVLHRQVEELPAASTPRRRMRGGFEELDTLLRSIDGQLRRLVNEGKMPSAHPNRPFERALADRVDAFAARSGITPKVQLTGALDLISHSQQIALLNIVQESLNNVREHAAARRVRIAVSASEDGVTVTIEDDGRGFDLERTLMRTAREGRVGLLAIHERVRLLGGRCRIQSRPGGPTVVSVQLDVYRSVATTGRGQG